MDLSDYILCLSSTTSVMEKNLRIAEDRYSLYLMLNRFIVNSPMIFHLLWIVFYTKTVHLPLKKAHAMRKTIKIILLIFGVLIILLAIFGSLFFLDLAAYTATGSQTLTPNGDSIGKALVTYDPGLSANSKNVADKVAADLQAKNYTVTLAGIKSSEASKTAGYTIIVTGGPIYAGSPTPSVKDFLVNLKPDIGTRIGVFGSGQGSTTPSDVAAIKDAVPSLTNGNLQSAIVVKIGEKEDLNVRAQDFVNQLIQ
jgi:flavodoxin